MPASFIATLTAFLILATASVHGAAPCAGDSTGIDKAKAKALRLDASINRFNLVKKVLYKQAVEEEFRLLHDYTTTLIDGVYDGDQIVKIVSQTEGEMEMLVSEYYFYKGGLMLVRKTLSIFDKPLTESGKLLRTKKFLYYFQGGRLHTCIYNENIDINFSEQENDVKGRELMAESSKYRDALAKK